MEIKHAKWKALGWISLAVLLALSLWFSASAVLSELTAHWGITGRDEPWVSAAVPAGFAAGALLSASIGLADRFNVRKLFAASALVGALLNSLLLAADSALPGIFLRFLTGMTLAGVYPSAVKALTLWFPKGRGLALGIVIGALTIGSALPHLFVQLPAAAGWEEVIGLSSACAVAAAFIMVLLVKDAPQAGGAAVFSVRLLGRVVRNKPVMLANYGYFGHMWELYAMWTWLPFFFESAGLVPSSLLSFLVIGCAGAAGCVAGGLLADKIGRARLALWAMGISTLCALVIGFSLRYSAVATIMVALLWGAAVIADSAQFSAAVSDFAEPEYLGTALTFQMSIGFLITIASINIVGWLQPYIGWEWLFCLLALGPLLGMPAMKLLLKFENEKRHKAGQAK